MKYKVIASVLVILLIVAVLALKGCAGSAPATDADGNPIPTENVQ